MHKRCLRRYTVGRGLDDKTPASAKDNNNNKHMGVYDGI
jgi:hypothetical protein